jgi:pyruvate dehydrogenase E2 component (dihydrolipoamide acetyltransferase)
MPLASIETDKAVFEVESPAAGTFLEAFFAAGDDIPVLTNIAAIGNPGEDISGLRPGGAASAVAAPADAAVGAAAVSAPASASASTPASDSNAHPAAGSTAVGVSPRARRAAAGKGLDALALAGSGPGGRVIERDVLAAAAAQPRMSAAAREAAKGTGIAVPAQGSGPGGMVLAGDLAAIKMAAAAVPSVPVVAAVPAGETVTVPLKGIRKIIAQRMRDSLSGTAQITLNMSFDATAILGYRAKVKAQAESLGLPNITVNDLIAFVVIKTLQHHPALNAHFLGDRTVQYPWVNLGIATDTERGLMVPVLHGAERLPLSGLSAAIKPLIKACQGGAINPDLLSGGTFTITNMGMLGIESFTPVLNVPEVAILGVGALFLKPVADGAGVRHVQAINLSLTVDHQVVDGAPAARFLKALCMGLENVELILAG